MNKHMTDDLEQNMDLDDKFTSGDSLQFIVNGERLDEVLGETREHEKRYIGELIFFDEDPMGNVVFTSEPEYNDIVLQGSISMLEKAFLRRVSWRAENISDVLDINADVLPDNSNLKEEFIFGFVAGVGGSGVTPGSVLAVEYTKNQPYGMIPFRSTSTPLESTVAAKYALHKETGGKHKYFAKKFTSTPQIEVLYTDGSEVPTSVVKTGTAKGIRVFAQTICDVNELDFREHFTELYGNLTKCRFNSLGLVIGFPHSGDFAGVRQFSLLNFQDKPLTNSKDTNKMLYTIYCI